MPYFSHILLLFWKSPFQAAFFFCLPGFQRFPEKDVDYLLYTVLPDGIETVPPRFAINYRNKFMLENADFVITYVTHSWGGAAKYKQMAEKKKKRIIELGE